MFFLKPVFSNHSSDTKRRYNCQYVNRYRVKARRLYVNRYRVKVHALPLHLSIYRFTVDFVVLIEGLFCLVVLQDNKLTCEPMNIVLLSLYQ